MSTIVVIADDSIVVGGVLPVPSCELVKFPERLRLGGCWFSEQAAEKVATALGWTPPASEDDVVERDEIARIEENLERARMDRVISRWAYDTPGPDDAHSLKSSVHSYLIGLDNASTINRPWGGTRLEAARSAQDRLNVVLTEAERKKLPEPEKMTQHEREDELDRRGWQHAYGGPSANHHQRPIWMAGSGEAGTENAWPDENEPWEVSTCRALREARRLDGDEQ